MPGEELSIITKAYDFILWSLPHISNFPRDRRFVLGERMETCLFDILDSLIQAKYSSGERKRGSLSDASVSLHRLRFQFRLCHDLGILKVKSYEFAAQCIEGMSAEMGKWIKAVVPKP